MVGFDWIFFAIVVPWPVLALWDLYRTPKVPRRDAALPRERR